MSDHKILSHNDLEGLDFKFKHIEIKEYSDKLWIQLEGCGELDKYVWTFGEIEFTEDNLLEFSIEVANPNTSVPDELQKYGAHIIIKSLEEMVKNNQPMTE